MNPLEELAARGLRVSLKDGQPVVGPRELVTEWALRFLKEHRDRIVALLTAERHAAWLALHLRTADALPEGLDPAEYARVDALIDALDEEAVEREVVRLRSRPEPSRVQIPHRPEEADTQLDEVFATLERQGAEGWTTNQYLAAGIPRTPARVGELRQLGFLIDSPTWEKSKVRYVFRGAMPGTHAAGWEAAGRPEPVSVLWRRHKPEIEAKAKEEKHAA